VSVHPATVIHITPSIAFESFGIGAVVRDLATAQQKRGMQVVIWTAGRVEHRAALGPWADLELNFPGIGPQRLAFSPRMKKAARSVVAGDVVVHLHGIWTALSWVSGSMARRGIPVVVAPHGSLESWALRRSRLKKWLARVLYEDQNLRRASALHAVAESEALDIASFGLDRPVAVIPNGVSRDWLASRRRGSTDIRVRFGIPAASRLILFVSRITPKKNIIGLLHALAALPLAPRNWILVIAGPDEFDHLRQVREAVSRLGLGERVRLIGPITGQLKRQVFAEADLFVLPSLSEGAPVVVAEALGAGCPVICTKASAWAALEDHGCGWSVDCDRDALASVLSTALSLADDTLRQMGERGRSLIEAKYLWEQIATDSEAVYSWLLGRQSRPPCVLAGEGPLAGC
jgi:glycosyltransferase involved in cell wall biosynthesis